jgi:hypothetical protein
VIVRLTSKLRLSISSQSSPSSEGVHGEMLIE